VTEQTMFAFPQPLTEKYRPTRIAEFVGLPKVKKIIGNLCVKPFPSSWFFLGPSGTGKTTMALALVNEMPAELHHIASKECTLETVQDVARKCHYMPRMVDDCKPCKMHVVLVDEADQMSYPAQLAFLSILDATGFPPNTIFIFTGNATANLEDRFLSRVMTLEFSSYGMGNLVTDLLGRVWDQETDSPTERPNFARIVKESNNNVREALGRLQVEIMGA
jgi:replication-associated recombination protein RarA